jgi:hypothetical protein
MPQRLNEPYEKLTAAVAQAAAATRTQADVDALVARLARISADLSKMADRIRAERERVSTADVAVRSESARCTAGDGTP